MRRAPHAQLAASVALAALSLLRIACAASMGGVVGVPENITVTFLNPTTVRVSWSTATEYVAKYDVTYKPTDARVVLVVAGNSDAVTLSGLEADTQYQVTVAAVWGGHKYRSRPIVFRTLEPPRTSPQQDAGLAGATPRSPPAPPDPSPTFPTIRGVEVGIVLMVLMVWIGAIALFFNRWGKIRMLLPYQPDYKQEQLKVPGTGVCSGAAGGTCGAHSAPSACSAWERPMSSSEPIPAADDDDTGIQHLHWSHTQAQSLECEEHLLARTPRPRVNSAIFMSAEPTGFAAFDAGDFLRRYGSQSKLCRKARSADNIPLTTMHESSERLCRVKPREETISEEAKSDDTDSSIETVKHFGLPILSVSGPSPPDEDYDQIDEYL